jgi:hypothetical protein
MYKSKRFNYVCVISARREKIDRLHHINLVISAVVVCTEYGRRKEERKLDKIQQLHYHELVTLCNCS